MYLDLDSFIEIAIWAKFLVCHVPILTSKNFGSKIEGKVGSTESHYQKDKLCP